MEGIAREIFIRTISAIVALIVVYFLIIWIEKQMAKRQLPGGCGCEQRQPANPGNPIEEFVQAMPDFNLIG